MTPPPPPQARPSRRRLLLLGALGVGLLLLASVARPHLVDAFRTPALLAVDLTDGDTLSEHLLEVPNPEATLRTFWDSGKISHRRAVLDIVLRPGAPTNAFRSQVLTEAFHDPDLTLREKALGSIGSSAFTPLTPAIAPQLTDPDPEVRRLGIQALRRSGSLAWTPSLLPLLADPDPSVALAVDSLLRRWSGQDFGLRLTNALPGHQGILSPSLSDETRQRLAEAGTSWREWWNQASQPPDLVLPQPFPPPPRRPVADFTLPDLQGRPHRLSDFRGRTVLLNFWATWCTPCAVEMPALTELQRTHPDALVILGINLDSFQDGPLADSPQKPALPSEEPAALRRLVGLVAARHRLNYPVLLDPTGSIAHRFEGNELPTQVLIDPDGRLVRRFVGGRSPAAWDALLRFAADDVPSGVSGSSATALR